MVWDQHLRRLSWAFFFLMWPAVGLVVYAAIMEEPEPPLPAIAALFTCVMLFALLQAGSFFVGWREKEWIRAKGVPAKATILNVEGTGTRINNLPLLRIELEVQPPYDSRFRVTVEYLVPYSALPQVQPGRIVRVHYLEDTKEVALDGL